MFFITEDSQNDVTYKLTMFRKNKVIFRSILRIHLYNYSNIK